MSAPLKELIDFINDSYPIEDKTANEIITKAKSLLEKDEHEKSAARITNATTVGMPKTLEEMKQVRQTILELMTNSHCDKSMFLTLTKKLQKVAAKIEELSKQNNCQ